jgi:hypothetical protein
LLLQLQSFSQKHSSVEDPKNLILLEFAKSVRSKELEHPFFSPENCDRGYCKRTNMNKTLPSVAQTETHDHVWGLQTEVKKNCTSRVHVGLSTTELETQKRSRSERHFAKKKEEILDTQTPSSTKPTSCPCFNLRT